MSNEQTADRIAVSDDQGNTIWLRNKRMGFGLRNKVLSAATHMVAGSEDASIDVGAYNNAVLFHNIVAWSGPDLDTTPISMAALDDLDPDLGDAALTKILELNPNRNADPKDSNGTTSSG